MADQLLKPSDVARELGVASNTLRVYSARFAPVLTASAARPVAGEGGGSGHRLYAARDVAILRRARELVAAGATYDEALDQLRGEYGVPATAGRAGVSVSDDLAAHLATLQQAVDAWRSLAEERTRELAEVRARLAAAEAALAAERRGRPAESRAARPDPVPQAGAGDLTGARRAAEPSGRGVPTALDEAIGAGIVDEPPVRRLPATARRAAERRDERFERPERSSGSWLSRLFPGEAETRGG